MKSLIINIKLAPSQNLKSISDEKYLMALIWNDWKCFPTLGFIRCDVQLYYTSNVSVVVKGIPSNVFTLEKGTHQGCPFKCAT